ncbi:hypothetical protein V8E36_003139 [Tilletia maclaganii]
MQLAKSFTPLFVFLATAVLAAPLSERLIEARLIFPGGGSSSNTTAAGLPTKDAFYQPPSGWQSKSNGAVLRSRQVKSSISAAAGAYQILYKTTDALGNADTSVTTVLIPKNPVSPPKIVSIQLPEDSASVDCAPSAALVANSQSKFAIAIPFVNQGLNPSLSNGYYVNIPDHEGSRALVFVGDMEGHAVLDSLKAVTKFPTAIPSVSTKTPIVLGGYSGGAHASAWASQLWPTYAKSLNIVVQVIGGTPVNVTNILNYLSKTFAGFAGAGVVGEYNAYPDLKEYIDAHIYPNGTAYLKDIQNNKCLLEVILNYGGKDLFSLFKKKDPLNDPIPQRRLNHNVLGNDGSTLKVPTIMYHSDKDDTIPFADAQKYASKQCAKGAKLKFVADSGKSHIGEELNRANDLGKWIDQFHKGTADSSCA